jgi:hypothetical protein
VKIINDIQVPRSHGYIKKNQHMNDC